MKAYIGQTRSYSLIAELTRLGFGEMTVRGELKHGPRRTPWAFDNGCYRDWKAGRRFDEATFCADLDRICGNEYQRPDFIVAPDMVACGTDSLQLSALWEPQLTPIAPVYLAVQDGMTAADVAPVLEPFAGIFIGGTVEWKEATALRWRFLCNVTRKQLHIGRIGTARKVRWAYSVGADSIDSCTPLIATRNLDRFCNAMLEVLE